MYLFISMNINLHVMPTSYKEVKMLSFITSLVINNNNMFYFEGLGPLISRQGIE